jgi:hypothetical protein
VALSSTEAGLDALVKGTTAAMVIRDLLMELGFVAERPTVMWEDNLSTIALTKAAGNWGPTKLQLADIFAKVLA